MKRPLLLFATLAGVALGGGCATSQYAPQLVARGEITMRYDQGFELYAGGKQIAHGLGSYGGLERYVRCVPQARAHANSAAHYGRAAVAFSILGGVIGTGGFMGFGAIADTDNWGIWLGSGFAVATVGLVFAGLSRRFKNQANGHAVDAVNYYNDNVGSLGATCDDLVYPAPAGPAPSGPPPSEAQPLTALQPAPQ